MLMRVFISFDFDRTLADYSKAHGNAILEGIYETFDKKFPVNWFEISTSGMTDLQMIISLVHNHGISYHTIFEQMDECISTISDKFQKYLNVYPVELLDKSEKVLDELNQRNNVVIGLSTGNIRNIGLAKTRYTGIDNYFSFGSFGEESFNRYQLLQNTKKRLIQNYGYTKRDIAIHIGDAVLDVLAAKKAGLIPIGVTTGGNTRQDFQKIGTKFIFDNLTELNESFDEIL